MKNQTYRMTMLYDFYGDLLTDRQKEFYDLYYNEDLSLAEIAENYGISRQGVRDIIVRGEAQLQEVEDKTGLIKRYQRNQEAMVTLQQGIQDILVLNEESIHSDPLEELCRRLDAVVSALRKD